MWIPKHLEALQRRHSSIEMIDKSIFRVAYEKAYT